MTRAREVVARERLALVACGEHLRSAALPPAHRERGTFLHGFLLPFSLLAATLRHRQLGARLLWLVVVRALVVVLVASVLFQEIRPPDLSGKAPWTVVVAHRWAWVGWFVSILSMTEAAVAFLSRRFDDHIAFHLAGFARIRAEEPGPPVARLSLGLGELFTKGKRFVRGYLVLATGMPIIFLFTLVPTVGDLLASVALFAWTAYWFGVFSAGKSKHAYADEASAPSPRVFRDLRDHSATLRWLFPVALYARLAAWVVRSANAPAMTFERNSTAFLGLALARLVLSLPGLYNLSRPVIAVAAGRLCAETDPEQRFSL